MGCLNNQEVLYKKQFEFQKNICTEYTVIGLIEDTEKGVDNKIFVCAVFVDLQKTFDTVDHNLFHKLSHYGIRYKANYWFSSYLGVFSGSPSFLIYINDPHNAIELSQSFHFADYTCLLNTQNTIFEINKTLNKDLKELLFWLNAKKIALNVSQT